MPPLQVKDFPADMYERLRACASEENRSISQQTITIIQEFLDARDAGRRRRRTPGTLPSFTSSDANNRTVDDSTDSASEGMPTIDPPLQGVNPITGNWNDPDLARRFPIYRPLYCNIPDNTNYLEKRKKTFERIHELGPWPDMDIPADEIIRRIREEEDSRHDNF